MTVTSAPGDPFATPDLDRAIADAETRALVLWRGEEVPFLEVPERIAATDERGLRDRFYGAWIDALEALNPLYLERLAAWTSSGNVLDRAAEHGRDPREFAADLQRFVLNGETPYYAALRRYLALVDIEQGDATEADAWHIARGAAWAHWFNDRAVRRALAATGRPAGDDGRIEGFQAAERQLAGRGEPSTPGAAAVASAFASLAGSPEWLADELGVAPAEVVPLVDFVGFAQLLRLRRSIGELHAELRLFSSDDRAVHRAYYSGMVGHMIGVSVHEAGYLRSVTRPFAVVERIGTAICGAMLVDTLESRHGAHWWRDAESRALVDRVAAATTLDDAVAELGYDALDWRPVLRQIRTRLIGEMSGYGGPNITTRAGTRKV